MSEEFIMHNSARRKRNKDTDFPKFLTSKDLKNTFFLHYIVKIDDIIVMTV